MTRLNKVPHAARVLGESIGKGAAKAVKSGESTLTMMRNKLSTLLHLPRKLDTASSTASIINAKFEELRTYMSENNFTNYKLVTALLDAEENFDLLSAEDKNSYMYQKNIIDAVDAVKVGLKNLNNTQADNDKTIMALSLVLKYASSGTEFINQMRTEVYNTGSTSLLSMANNANTESFEELLANFMGEEMAGDLVEMINLISRQGLYNLRPNDSGLPLKPHSDEESKALVALDKAVTAVTAVITKLSEPGDGPTIQEQGEIVSELEDAAMNIANNHPSFTLPLAPEVYEEESASTL